jgi:hypothetical protein
MVERRELLSIVLIFSYRTLVALALLTLLPGSATAQNAPGAGAEPFEILDNSFLVEEAFNQPTGIFQNIVGIQIHDGSSWDFGFTQEWPVGSERHQFSYSVPVSRLAGETGLGDVLINYRYQLWTERAGRPAFSPRISVILPSGSEEDGLGAGVVGWQVNLPFSKQRGDIYLHGNAGFTSRPGRDEFTPHVAGSAIWRMRPMVHLMLEGVAEFEEDAVTTVSPGVRGGWNIGDRQVILGLAVPVTFVADASNAGAFLYFSYELPFAL